MPVVSAVRVSPTLTVPLMVGAPGAVLCLEMLHVIVTLVDSSPSVTVTVDSVVPASVGLPTIRPVWETMDSPAGSVSTY